MGATIENQSQNQWPATKIELIPKAVHSEPQWKSEISDFGLFFFWKNEQKQKCRNEDEGEGVSYETSTVDKAIWNPRREKAVGGRGIIQ